jgi:GH15 family glucan-1,4-alpha-glucosidase
VSVPIEDYALLGDTRSAALVSSAGSVDWWCLPRFDADPVCGRLLGGDQAGNLLLGPAEPSPVVERAYLSGEPLLRTTWRTPSGRLSLTEGMVSSVTGRLLPSTLLVRRAEALDGPVRVKLAFAPRHRWRRDRPRLQPSRNSVTAHLGGLAVGMTSEPCVDLDDTETAALDVRPGEPLTVVITAAWREPLVQVAPAHAWDLLLEDAARWRAWTDGVPADVPYRASVQRTLLVLRQLTYSPSGAPVAAATTSLPEEIGGARNWDYRLTWPRDASIGVAAFAGLDKIDEADMFSHWLLHASRLDRPRLPALFSLHGRRAAGERERADWPGYEQSWPVRTGNGARHQHQLDGYGWVVDAMSVYAGHHGRLHAEQWRAVRGFTDQVARRWPEPDAGIWEERRPLTHHTHSKLIAWLALDRALRLAQDHPVGTRRRRRWELARDQLAADVREHGFNSALATYTRTYGGDDLDAALLVLPLLGIEDPGSPRVSGTIDAIRQQLSAGGPLLYRYRSGDDGLAGGEGAFLPCSFWLVQALALTGRTKEARELMDELLDLAPLGLFPEEIDPTTGRFLGNFPQALTHASLLQAVLALRDAGIHE